MEKQFVKLRRTLVIKNDLERDEVRLQIFQGQMTTSISFTKNDVDEIIKSLETAKKELF